MQWTRVKGGFWIFRFEMITELMIILTVVGAGIVIFVWTGSRRRKGENLDEPEVAESTEKFRHELENTANEIIGRMESQATHLETLLDDTVRSRTQMEGRMAELKKLIKRSENQSSEVRELLTRLDGAVEDVDAMKRQIEQVERKISAVSSAKNSAVQKIAAYQQQQPPRPVPPKPSAFAQVLENAQAPASNQTATRSAAILPRENAQPQNPDAARIEAIRQNLIKNAAKISAQNQTAAKSTQNVRAPNIPVVQKVNRQASGLVQASAQKITPNPASKPETTTDSRSIRDMLLAGMPIEEVSRQTGLGRGAVELVQQMIRHQLEKRNG